MKVERQAKSLPSSTMKKHSFRDEVIAFCWLLLLVLRGQHEKLLYIFL
jgi:hypothetical protein